MTSHFPVEPNSLRVPNCPRRISDGISCGTQFTLVVPANSLMPVYVKLVTFCWTYEGQRLAENTFLLLRINTCSLLKINKLWNVLSFITLLHHLLHWDKIMYVNYILIIKLKLNEPSRHLPIAMSYFLFLHDLAVHKKFIGRKLFSHKARWHAMLALLSATSLLLCCSKLCLFIIVNKIPPTDQTYPLLSLKTWIIQTQI